MLVRDGKIDQLRQMWRRDFHTVAFCRRDFTPKVYSRMSDLVVPPGFVATRVYVDVLYDNVKQSGQHSRMVKLGRNDTDSSVTVDAVAYFACGLLMAWSSTGQISVDPGGKLNMDFHHSGLFEVPEEHYWRYYEPTGPEQAMTNLRVDIEGALHKLDHERHH